MDGRNKYKPNYTTKNTTGQVGLEVQDNLNLLKAYYEKVRFQELRRRSLITQLRDSFGWSFVDIGNTYKISPQFANSIYLRAKKGGDRT